MFSQHLITKFLIFLKEIKSNIHHVFFIFEILNNNCAKHEVKYNECTFVSKLYIHFW